jgi:hypothetical protein
MGKQMFNRTKKILGILLVVFFVASVTVATVSAYPGHDRGWYRNNGYHWYHNQWWDDDWWHSHRMHDNDDWYYHNNYHWWKGKWQDDHYR